MLYEAERVDGIRLFIAKWHVAGLCGVSAFRKSRILSGVIFFLATVTCRFTSAATVDVTVDLGNVNGPFEYVFHLNNSSAGKIKIVSVAVSCTCQEVDLKAGETLEPGASKAFRFRGNTGSSGPSEGTVVVECRDQDGATVKHNFKLKGIVSALVECRPSRVSLRYGQSDLLEVVFRKKELMAKFLRAESMFGLVEIDRLEGTDSSFVFLVKAVDDDPVTARLDARDIIVLHFNSGSEVERFSVSCLLSAGFRLKNKGEVNKDVCQSCDDIVRIRFLEF